MSTVTTVPKIAAAATAEKAQVMARKAAKAVLFGLLSVGLVLAVWLVISLIAKDLPGPGKTLGTLWKLISDPFYVVDQNDRGVGFLILNSMFNVGLGFLLGALVAIPTGILIGANETFYRIINPIAQVMKPVSPLAWFPLGMIVLASAPSAMIFSVFITSLWPTLFNTAFGVSSLPKDYKILGQIYRFSAGRYLRRVILPYTLPFILTGLRLSLGIAWMVIVAAEMLAGGSNGGIGFFVYDSWNSGNYEKVICGIIFIGFIGLLIDRVMEFLVKKTSHGA